MGCRPEPENSASRLEFPTEYVLGRFFFLILPLSLPLSITELVPCEAEWHPKVEGKDDYNGRVSPCPRRWVIIQITLCRLQMRGDRAVTIPVSSARKCVCLLRVRVFACVCVLVCVCLFQSHPRSQKTPVQSDKQAAPATPHLSATGAKSRADLAPRRSRGPLPPRPSLSLGTMSLFPCLQGTVLPLLSGPLHLRLKAQAW